MPKICYVPRRFNPAQQQLVATANAIVDEYAAQGFDLTLRQLYYQFVARDILPNTLRSYKNLGSLVNDARLAGLIDWAHIVDRTRFLRKLPRWDSPADIIESAAASFRFDKWATQDVRVEVWIEKDALVGVFEGVCEQLDVPFFSCRGYTSQSEMWGAAMRILKHLKAGLRTVVLHFGDHDPSGMDMSRDIEDRVRLFVEHHLGTSQLFELTRVALNKDQVDQYEPPPNPAKLTDSRAEGYISTYGADSWELDALEPTVLAALVRQYVEELRDGDAWAEEVEREESARATLQAASDHWAAVQAFVKEQS